MKCVVVRVSEALLFGAWMLAQVVSYAPSLQLAKSAAGRLFQVLDRKPQQYSTTSSDLANWVSMY